MANIWDLLSSAFHTTAENDSISMLYILYQGALFITSVFGPGAILMMMAGAMAVAFQWNDAYIWCILINFIPVAIFTILCFFASSKVQVRVNSSTLLKILALMLFHAV